MIRGLSIIHVQKKTKDTWSDTYMSYHDIPLVADQATQSAIAIEVRLSHDPLGDFRLHWSFVRSL